MARLLERGPVKILWIVFSRSVQIALLVALLFLLGMMAGPLLALMLAIVPLKLLWDLVLKRTKKELRELVILPFVFVRMAGLAAPAVAVMCLVFTGVDETRLLLAIYCPVFGICGLVTAITPLVLNIPWRYRQLRQVQALPRSKIRSAAMGLVELGGTAQPLHAHEYKEGSPILTSKKVEPFMLADGTGEVVVDPRGASVRTPNGLPILDFPMCEVVLTKRAIREVWHVAAGELYPGDEVYVLGSLEEVEPDSEFADQYSVIIRARRETAAMGWLSSLYFFDSEQAGAARRDWHVFFVADSSEWQARAHILRGIRKSLAKIAFWLVCSTLLLWLGARPFL